MSGDPSSSWWSTCEASHIIQGKLLEIPLIDTWRTPRVTAHHRDAEDAHFCFTLNFRVDPSWLLVRLGYNHLHSFWTFSPVMLVHIFVFKTFFPVVSAGSVWLAHCTAVLTSTSAVHNSYKSQAIPHPNYLHYDRNLHPPFSTLLLYSYGLAMCKHEVYVILLTNKGLYADSFQDRRFL